jgi:hypothetical protein
LEPVVMEPVTFQDYTKQVAEILEAEQEERLETEAIMNAPPFADSMLDQPDEEEATWLVAANSTETEDEFADIEMTAVEMDALEMDTLEMDAPVDHSLDVTTKEGVASDEDMDSPVGEDVVLDSDVNGEMGTITVDEDGMPVDN